jgi:Ca2+-binding RTX toxin-like protein
VPAARRPLCTNVENLTLVGLDAIDATGNELNNRLIGNNAGNILDGGTGNDSMFGWEGDDTYIVDSLGDLAAEGVPAGGIATVRSSVTFSLAATGNIEHLTLTGLAAIDGTGNGLGNTLTGNVAANVLNGAGGNDVLAGGAGNDTLNGGGGNDAMARGAGNDLDVVNRALDVATEAAGEGSADQVNSTVTYTLAEQVEKLSLTGAGAIDGTGGLANTIVGNAADNVLDGADGVDVMAGGAGNDTYIIGSRRSPAARTSTPPATRSTTCLPATAASMS